MNEFQVSTWGKKVDGEFVIDGYKFRGRQPFKRAKEGLDNLMAKGNQGEVEGIKYTVLDSRNKGIEHEADVEVAENAKLGVDGRGVAVLKMYGPSKKKENSVLVTKYKGSDIKFVTIIAEKIVKPLLINILGVKDKSHEIKQEKCEICPKSFDTMRALKSHITKMHKEENNIENVSMDTEILWNQEHETNEDILYEEIDKEIVEEKMYSSTCSQCKKQMNATKKYTLIQTIKKHRELKCERKNLLAKFCSDCDYQAKDEKQFKRHRRDKHDQTTASTSPPPKKAKIKELSHNEEDDENMEVDIVEGDDVERNLEHEDMETESVKSEELVRSKMMDEKVLAKIKDQEEKEKDYERKKEALELEKKKNEEKRLQESKQKNRKRKQIVKDVKKK